MSFASVGHGSNESSGLREQIPHPLSVASSSFRLVVSRLPGPRRCAAAASFSLFSLVTS